MQHIIRTFKTEVGKIYLQTDCIIINSEQRFLSLKSVRSASRESYLLLSLLTMSSTEAWLLLSAFTSSLKAATSERKDTVSALMESL